MRRPTIARILLVTALLAAVPLIGATAAAAQAPDEVRSVQGGAGAGTAPMLAPGRYRDVILPGDTLWYAFELGPGQVLHGLLTLSGGNASMLNPVARLQMELRSDDVLGGLRCDITAVRDLTDDAGGIAPQPPIEVWSPPIAPGGGLCREPGTYYVRLSLLDDPDLVEEGARLDVDLHVEVTDGAQPTDQAAADAAPPAGPGSRPASREADLQAPDMGLATLLFSGLGFGIAGLFVGTAAGRRLVNLR